MQKKLPIKLELNLNAITYNNTSTLGGQLSVQMVQQTAVHRKGFIQELNSVTSQLAQNLMEIGEVS